MPYHHKRKDAARVYHDFSEDKIKEAVREVKNGAGLRDVARKYEAFGIKKSTLSRRVRNMQTQPYGRPKALTDDELKYRT